jgi:hypothetical protein
MRPTIKADAVTLGEIGIGESRTLTFHLNVTNNDIGNCPSSNFWLGFGVDWPSAGWQFSASPSSLSLGVNQTGTSLVTVHTRENLAPGDHRISISTGDNVYGTTKWIILEIVLDIQS